MMKVLLVALVVLPMCVCSSSLTPKQLLKILDRIKSDKINFKDLISGSGARGSKKVLACPIPQTSFRTERTEPECTGKSSCSSGELCCPWFEKKHCLNGIDTEPRHGVCPKITMLNDMCLADYVGCRYDRECHGEDEKCCMNTNCGYHDCLSIRQNIACPMPKTTEPSTTEPSTTEPSTRNETRCLKNTQCEENELCCDWFSNRYCLKGIDTIPRQGFCPMTVPVSLKACKTDFPGCYHDSECSGAQEKCCGHQECDYFECMDINADFACPTVNFAAFHDAKGKTCGTNTDCDGFTSLCCDLQGNKHCVTGIHIPPKHGECPAVSDLTLPCLSQHSGDCEYDSQCDGDKKCCDTNCGYKQCMDEKPVPIESEAIAGEKRDILERIIKELDM